jgi:hypothetical protein
MRRDISSTRGKESCDSGGMGELCVENLSIFDAIPSKGGCGRRGRLFLENEAEEGW